MMADLLAHEWQGSGTSREDTRLENYCIALQPICDASMNHVADELLYRDSPEATFARIPDEQAVVATARVCHTAFYEIGVEELVGSRSIFINAPRDWLLNPELLPPHPARVVVEVLENVVADRALMNALRRIRAMGYRIALDDFVLTEATRPLLDVAHIVKIDMLQPFNEQDVEVYKRRGLTLFGEKVEDIETFERLRDMGFTLFQGYFYAKAKTQDMFACERHNNRAALLKFLVALQRGDAKSREIERIIAQDPQLTFLLLRYANSALFHYNGEINTLFQALQLLGLRRAANLALTMLLANHGPACKLLLSRALTRAAMCERLAPRRPKQGEGEAFFVGLLSMMADLLGKSLEQMLAELRLSKDVTAALFERRGALGQLLSDIESFEHAQVRGWSPDRVELFNQTWFKSQVWSTYTLSLINESYLPCRRIRSEV